MYKFTKFDKANMEMAYLTAGLSYCQKRQVGAVIVKDDRVIANGFNGTSKGTENICEDKYIVCKLCNNNNDITKLKPSFIGLVAKIICISCINPVYFKKEDIKITTNDKVIHAEQNAILFAARNGISINGSTLYVTTEPCIECAKFIEASGIKKVIYRDLYKSSAGVEYLQNNGVECYRYDVLDLQNGK